MIEIRFVCIRDNHFAVINIDFVVFCFFATRCPFIVFDDHHGSVAVSEAIDLLPANFVHGGIGRQLVPTVFVVHPDTTIALQAANEVGVVGIDFEVVAVERLFFDGNADHGLPVVVIIQQFVACLKVGGVDPVGVFDVAVLGLACRCAGGLGRRRIGRSRDGGCPRRWFVACHLYLRQRGRRYPGRCS